jgi:group II intron reverse transcriptase/maturase
MSPNEKPTGDRFDETTPKPSDSQSGRERVASQRKAVVKAHSLIDKVYSWDNLWTAWRRVRANKGVHGLDRVTIRAYEQDVETHLRELQRKLMEDRYEPLPVRRVYIPKASNPKQMRPLGIPTVTDRVCQQAVYQVLCPIFDPHFSARSYGFRPGRNAHRAIATAFLDAEEGYRSVVDADISSFFDQLDHEVVMSQVCTRVADGRVLRLIEAFLKAGVSEDGVISVPTKGSPQGGVISPLLANIVLDVFDKAIEAKGWRHVRYADDFVILTRSPEEAARALAYAKEVLGNLKLSLHEQKTRLTDFRKGFEFLGFHFRSFRLGIRAKSLERLKDRVRFVTRRNQGRNVEAVLADLNPIIRGYANYFGVAEVASAFRKLDKWLRMRVRSFRLKRRVRTANHRLPNKKLVKWGMLSLLECRPRSRFPRMRSYKPGERAVGSLR